jgi:hypothetical protein
MVAYLGTIKPSWPKMHTHLYLLNESHCELLLASRRASDERTLLGRDVTARRILAGLLVCLDQQHPWAATFFPAQQFFLIQ